MKFSSVSSESFQKRFATGFGNFSGNNGGVAPKIWERSEAKENTGGCSFAAFLE